MPPPLLTPSKAFRVTPEPLTPLSFSSFGTAISSPLPAAQSTVPKSLPLRSPPYPSQQPEPVIVNQSTALKYSPISPLTDNYPDATSHGPAKPLLSMFSCFPRKLNQGGNFDVQILERHPFTTQTFTPLGLSANDPDACFLVIVAPSLPESLSATKSSEGQVEIPRPPDLHNLKAFVAHGGQAVTYGAGTWHAPMVVLGRRRVDFVVTQFVSGIVEEDCQEVTIGEGVVVKIGRDFRGPRL
jgi:ureidoglycolate lyase